MSEGQYKNIRNQGAGEFRKEIASYSPSTAFFNKIFESCGFGNFKGREILLLDAMSGPGRLGKDLEKAYNEKMPKRPLRVSFNDLSPEVLAPLASEGYGMIACDVRKISESGKKFDIITVRYGLKDLPREEIPIALASLRASLNDGGRLVIPDMTAFTPQSQIGVIEVHSAKQEAAGRDRKGEGVCFIPRVHQWSAMLHEAGFSIVNVYPGFTSNVETSQWKGQFGPNADDARIIAELNRKIIEVASTKKTFANEFNVRTESEKVFVDFPLMVACAIK